MKCAHGSLAALVASALVWHAGDARACGGYFAPSSPEKPVVTGHRMAFSLSSTQSVLWDQIQYSGVPSEFAWVLPVGKGARLEISNDAWFAALDAATQPVVNPPDQTSQGVSGGCAALGCGSSSSASGSASPPGSVQVLSEGVAGIYETVTLHSTDPDALEIWLTQNGYEIPQSIEPTLGAYVAEGFDFIALRLRPDCGAQAMQPVRIITPGAGTTLPLRMVAAGVASQVDVTLYVITEGRMHPQNFPDAAIDYSRLTWSLASGGSNYDDLATAAMQTAGGYAWITEFAGLGQMEPDVVLPGASSLNPGIADAYFGACGRATDAGGGALPCPDAGGAPEGGASGDLDASDASDASDDAGASGGTPDTGPLPTPLCAGFDDIDVALVGQHLNDVWVTRLRASLPVGALASDLVLEAAPSQSTVSNVHQAVGFSDASTSSTACASAPQLRETAGTWTLIALGALGTGALLRRRRRA
jgi:hypothetical protein